ncbi:MAG: DUF2723 domain-containing protein [Anaerolinea sp.]|nr:DUF2723 domain-containing protein [Anaerolinea sp.]
MKTIGSTFIRWQAGWFWLALLIVAAAWLTTLQTDIGAANDQTPDTTGLVGPLMDDSAEFVVAWHTWGVTHPPAYPLLNFLGNVITHLLRILPISPVTAANLVSFGSGLVALALLGRLVAPRSGAAAAAVLLPAFGGLVWLYSNVAEVYAFGLLLGTASLTLALAVGRRPQRPLALAFGLLFGLTVGHHRTLLALTPALAVALWPARRLGWQVWVGAAALAVSSLAVYAYLPLAALSGSPWIYGRSPTTWPGFLDAVLAREYEAQLLPPHTFPAIIAALGGRFYFLAQEMTWPGLLLGIIGLGAALSQPHTRRLAIILGLTAAGYFLAPVGQYLLIGTHMLIMVASFALSASFALGIMAWGRRYPFVVPLGLLLALAVAGNAWMSHRPWVTSYTKDPLGRQMIAAMVAVTAVDPAPTLVETWGPRYFAFAYGKWVSGDLPEVELLDARADLRGLEMLSRRPQTLYTTQDMLYVTAPDVWATRLGGAVALESAGDGLVAVRQHPRLAPVTAQRGAVEIAIHAAHGWREKNGDARLTITWQAITQPTADYHIFVHLTDRPDIAHPDDIVAQGDRQHPVYGFYPTSRWTAGELVRDDYRIALPAKHRPLRAFVGLYTIASDGAFINHLRQEVIIHSRPLSLSKGGVGFDKLNRQGVNGYVRK